MTFRSINRLVLLPLIVACGLGLFLVFPHLVSAYHLEAGGRAMDDAASALEHLRRAIDWDPNNAQAYRLLGQVYREQGDWPAAIEALTTFTRLRPHNPLGHIELAEAYEEIEAGAAGRDRGSLDAQIAAQWRDAGMTANDLDNAGEQAREATRYDEALAWYQRAIRLEPSLGDPWYYTGLLYEDLQRWSEALDAYQQASAEPRFNQVHRSSPYYQAGILSCRRLDPPQLDTALAALNVALAADDFGSVVEAADCHYWRGLVLRAQDASPEEILAEFQKAVSLDPKHAYAHFELGMSLYDTAHDASGAEAELLTALQLARHNKRFYYQLGELYRWEGRVDEAATMYEQALIIDPEYKAARKGLEALGDRQ
jgi:tetratricopeptide (TPR) repeat protein